MAAAASLRPVLHAATYRTLIGLLVVTGMRLRERSAWTAPSLTLVRRS